jgi:hypothetical protein
VGARDELDDAEADTREALNETGMALIGTAPIRSAGIVIAISYMRKQMRNDGTFMPI